MSESQGKHALQTLYSPNPVLPLHVANKQYVDLVSGGATFARVVKKVDEIVNNSAAMQDDDELKVTLNINKVYGYFFFWFFNSPTTPDIKKAWTLPAGATGTRINATWDSNNISRGIRDITLINNIICDGNDSCSMEAGRVIMAGTAGDLQFQWAQNAANASDTKVLQGSYLVVYEELA